MLRILARYIITASISLLLIYLVLTIISIENQKLYSFGWHTAFVTGKQLFFLCVISILALTLISNAVLDVSRVLLSKRKKA
jgi:hypothetical protein